MKFFRSGSGGSSRWAAAWVLMAALVWSASSARADSGSAQAQANKEAVNKAFAAWAAGGRTFFDDMLAPNVVWTIKGSSPTARVLRGKQELIDGAVMPMAITSSSNGTAKRWRRTASLIATAICGFSACKAAARLR
jgi:uncharacterized protein